MTVATPTKGTGVVSPETHQVKPHGPLQVRRIHPGISLGQRDDSGFGGLGVIDHARLQLDVRFGSLADICSAKRHVRFTPES
jgi:hypothetical protein